MPPALVAICGLTLAAQLTYARWLRGEIGSIPRQFRWKISRKDAGAWQSIPPENWRPLYPEFSGLFRYEDRLRRGRNTVTLPNEPRCVLSAASACNTD